jgi:eukaryotic-like serine/threonine-protein kinase
MTPERWREVERVYQFTMDREPRLRAAFLSEICGTDEELRREVHSLLELNHSPVLVDEPAWQAAAELLGGSNECVRGTQLGPYRIEAILGSGGMGRVYQAHDTRLGRTVALKICRLEFNDRFEREARAVAALNHPNVCTIHDVGPDYLVMELVEGPTLADRMKQGPIPLEEALRIARQIADALEAAHEKGIVHRDLKPGNIKVKPDGAVKVLDFGLAKLLPVEAALGSNPEDSPTLSIAATTAGMLLGTAAYMSPEQARGKAVDKRADIWAFGVVLHEMLTGRRLFEGEDVTDTLALVLKAEPQWDGIPANVQRLLKSCLQKDPKRRLRDIGDGWQFLELSSTEAVPARSRRAIAGWIVAAFALALASALAFVHFGEKLPDVHAVRFQIFPPAQTTFTGNDALLSPDGRRIAFQARGSDGRNQLWVRSLDSIEARPLAGTEGVNNASFWSPDSQFLAFAMSGKLQKIDVSGSSVQTICDIPPPVKADGQPGTWRAGAWSRRGVIIFGANGTGLWRVSERGGPPSELTILNPALKELFHAGPNFLPDGRHFFYHRIVGAGGGVYLGSVDVKPEQQSSTRLVTSDSSAVYAPSPGAPPDQGHMLFVRRGSLMAQAFDARRLRLAGEAVPVAEGVASGGSRHFSVSMTGALAYQAGGYLGSGVTRNQLTWFDREGKVLGPAGEPGAHNSLALSPDGTRVAVSSLEGQGTPSAARRAFDIWVHEFARNTSTRLTFRPSWDWIPAWSPDGNRIVFSSERDSIVFDLYGKASSGVGEDELLLQSNQDKTVQDWSRDGRFLLYSVAVSGGRTLAYTASHDLYVLPLTSGSPHDRKPQPYLETEFNESQGKFSPDGRFIAYRSDASGRNEVYVQPFPDAPSGKWKVSTAGGTAPRWSGDGRELFYISPESKLMAVEVSASPVFKAGIPKALFTAITWVNAGPMPGPTPYDVTADGKKFLIITHGVGAGSPGATPITVVLNWTALLKR